MRTVKTMLMLVLCLVCAAGGLSGCGQKGDLYLPGKPDRLQPRQS